MSQCRCYDRVARLISSDHRETSCLPMPSGTHPSTSYLWSDFIYYFPFSCHLPVPIMNSDFLFSIVSISQQLSQSSRTDRTKVLELIKKDRLYGCGWTFLMVEQHVKRSCVSVWASVFLYTAEEGSSWYVMGCFKCELTQWLFLTLR